MPEEISQEESFKALMGLLAMRPHIFTAEVVQMLHNEHQRQEGLNDVLAKACMVEDVFVAELAISFGAEVSIKGYAGYTPAHWAAAIGCVECLKLLIANRADVNAKNNDGKTPAQLARTAGKAECYSVLLEQGAEGVIEQSMFEMLRDSFKSSGRQDIVKLMDQMIDSAPE